MLNTFQDFMSRASAFYNSTNKQDMSLGGGIFPYSLSAPLPTRTMKQPVKIFKVEKEGNAYKIMADRNVVWNCPDWLYDKMERSGQKPTPGKRMLLTYNMDNTVKNYQIFM